MGDDRTAALNYGTLTEIREAAKHSSRENLVAPTCRDHIGETGAQACMRELHWGCGSGGQQRVRAENDNRHSLWSCLLSRCGSRHRESHEYACEKTEVRHERTLLCRSTLTKPIN